MSARRWRSRWTRGACAPFKLFIFFKEIYIVCPIQIQNFLQLCPFPNLGCALVLHPIFKQMAAYDQRCFSPQPFKIIKHCNISIIIHHVKIIINFYKCYCKFSRASTRTFIYLTRRPRELFRANRAWASRNPMDFKE